jgi:hypothetical protein
MLKTFLKKYKISVVILAYLVFVFLLYRLAIFPLTQSVRDKADDIQKRIVDNQIEKERLGKISELEEAYGEYQKNKETLEVVLDAQYEVDFIKKLEILAEETGNKISLKIEEADKKTADKNKAVLDKKKEEEKTVREKLSYNNFISMQINLRGNYVSLVNFIHKLENSAYYVNILSIDIKKEKEALEKKIEKVNVQSDTLFTPGSKTAPKEEPASNEPQEREILNTTLNVVIYLKK